MIEWMRRQSAKTADFVMCCMLNAFQWRLRRQMCSQKEFDDYLRQCEPLTREEFYAVPEMDSFEEHRNFISWKSPLSSGFPKNDRVHAKVFLSGKKWNNPTLIILHALMSASDAGYRLWAKKFNRHGWNVVFLHLPFHYSRKPKGFFNGELTIAANLLRNGETIRQAVIEVRQLLQFLRMRGCREFGLWAVSYGGWIGALVLSLEKDFRFASLMQPIASVEHAIWKGPTSRMMRRLLAAEGITPEESARHAHLSSPLHAMPACDPSRIVIFGGRFDTISPVSELEKLHSRWKGSRLVVAPQGHFGYIVMRKAWEACLPFLDA